MTVAGGGRVYVILLVGIFMVSGALGLVISTFQRQLNTLALDLGDNLIRYVSVIENERLTLDDTLGAWADGGEGAPEFAGVVRQIEAFAAAVDAGGGGLVADIVAGLPGARQFFNRAQATAQEIARAAGRIEARDAAALARAHRALTALRRGLHRLSQQALARANENRRDNYVQLRTSMWQAVVLFSGIFFIWAGISTMLHLEKRKVSQLRDRLEERVKERTAELAESNRELMQANESLRQFAFVASHDLQEPLRKIKTFASVLDSEVRGTISADARHALQVIGSSADRLRALVGDLLEYSRVSNAALTLREVDLAAAVAAVLQDLEVQIEETGAEVVAAGLPRIEADPTHVNQLLQNLIGNALKYRAKDRPCLVQIAAKTGVRPGETVLTVTDNGIGFAPEQGRRIFEPFQRLHRAADYSGTGIGLAICARIAERHGWTLEAEGRPGEGATFRLVMRSGAQSARAAHAA